MIPRTDFLTAKLTSAEVLHPAVARALPRRGTLLTSGLTFIRTYDDKRIIVPNSQIFTESVLVITAYDRIRSEYDVGIGYGDDVSKAKGILLDILEKTDGVFADPKPDVLVWDLAGSTVNLRIRWWSEAKRSAVVHLRDAVLHQVRDRLTAEGIDLPYPTSVVLFHDQSEEVDGDRAQQREGWPVGARGKVPRPRRDRQTELPPSES